MYIRACTPPFLGAAIQYVLSISAEVEKILLGSAAMDPAQYGMTSDEERTAANAGNVGWQDGGPCLCRLHAGSRGQLMKAGEPSVSQK